ncbi:GAF and ANTAR domain-containing protein [Streptomyces sp. NPDC050560]|uniref:GAF and ANTAR domain-containing protein n=1 Tax=Streptomyces sp. NPDC050560 TaxID=3365630 RepID=UPI0037B13862
MDWQDFAVRMAALARDLMAQESVDSTLQRVTTSAVEIIDGCDAAGVMVVRNGAVRTLAATNPLATSSDRLQETYGEGPCIDTRPAAGHRVFRVEDFNAPQDRWRRYVPAARDLGIGSMMGFLLYTEQERNLGALNLYSKSPAVFDEDSEIAGWSLASHAAVGVAGARHTDQFRQGIESRHTIGQAMGIVMERHHISEEEAFDAMRRLSQERNEKLRDIALRICQTGSFER